MGKWFHFDSNWPWYTDSVGGLIEYKNGSWHAHKPVLKCNRLPTFEHESSPCQEPQALSCATVYFNRSRIVCSGASSILPSTTEQPKTFLHALQFDKTLHWCLHDLHIENEQSLLEALQDGSAIAISDGSHKVSFGTVAWTIGDTTNAGLVSGKAVCPGADEDMDLYRSELAGIYCIMVVLEKFCSFYSLSEGVIEIGCDGLSALDSVFEKGDQLFHDVPSFDLVASILKPRRKSCLTWWYRHDKGHQDEGSGPLDFWAL